MGIDWLFWIGLVVVLMLSGMVWYLRVPPVPSLKKDLERFFRIVKVQPDELVFDLGAGDGRVLEVARDQYGASISGWELSPIMWLLAKFRLGWSADVRLADMWKAPVGQADVVFMFLMPALMSRAETEIWAKMKSGARLVTNAFPLPNVRPDIQEDKICLYIR